MCLLRQGETERVRVNVRFFVRVGISLSLALSVSLLSNVYIVTQTTHQSQHARGTNFCPNPLQHHILSARVQLEYGCNVT